jgi:hypothetical protein
MPWLLDVDFRALEYPDVAAVPWYTGNQGQLPVRALTARYDSFEKGSFEQLRRGRQVPLTGQGHAGFSTRVDRELGEA